MAAVVSATHPRAIITSLARANAVIAALAATPYDVPVLGCSMPDMNGGAPIEGAVAYLMKPVNQDIVHNLPIAPPGPRAYGAHRGRRARRRASSKAFRHRAGPLPGAAGPWRQQALTICAEIRPSSSGPHHARSRWRGHASPDARRSTAGHDPAVIVSGRTHDPGPRAGDAISLTSLRPWRWPTASSACAPCSTSCRRATARLACLDRLQKLLRRNRFGEHLGCPSASASSGCSMTEHDDLDVRRRGARLEHLENEPTIASRQQHIEQDVVTVAQRPPPPRPCGRRRHTGDLEVAHVQSTVARSSSTIGSVGCSAATAAQTLRYRCRDRSTPPHHTPAAAPCPSAAPAPHRRTPRRALGCPGCQCARRLGPHRALPSEPPLLPVRYRCTPSAAPGRRGAESPDRHTYRADRGIVTRRETCLCSAKGVIVWRTPSSNAVSGTTWEGSRAARAMARPPRARRRLLEGAPPRRRSRRGGCSTARWQAPAGPHAGVGSRWSH